MSIKFKHGYTYAMRDCKTFSQWADKEITPEEGAFRISENNMLSIRLTPEEFVEEAHSLGYWRINEQEDSIDWRRY